jgi:hypothetical protein
MLIRMPDEHLNFNLSALLVCLFSRNIFLNQIQLAPLMLIG